MGSALKKYRVRLRNERLPVPISTDGQVNGKDVTLRATLIPNQWVEVPEEIYVMLKSKFALRSDVTRMVPDFRQNEKAPHHKDDSPIMREEQKPGYIIEFD